MRLSLFSRAILVICQPREDAALEDPQVMRSAMTAKSLIGSIDAFSERYRVPVRWCAGRREGTDYTLTALRRFWEDAKIPGARRPTDPKKDAATLTNFQLSEMLRRLGTLEALALTQIERADRATIDRAKGSLP